MDILSALNQLIQFTVDSSMSDQLPDRLCKYCEKLQFHLLNQREEKQYPLWSKKQIRENVSCPFCRLARWGGAEDIPDDGRKIYATWIPDKGFSISKMQTLAFLDDGNATSPHGMARNVHPTINPSLINKWISICDTHHPETCSPTPGVVAAPEYPAGIKVLRMIDVANQCIVEASPGCRYVALSYVWGRVKSVDLLTQNKSQLMSHGGLLPFRNLLPRTINDAIDLLRSMGEQYLWVDSLCIQQDNDEEKGDTIAKMHLVYRGSILTILAGAGDDANYGLPGVHFGSRRPAYHAEPYRRVLQYTEEVQPGIRMTTITPVYDNLTSAKHRTRAWTCVFDPSYQFISHDSVLFRMQEHVLSHRLLIFTHGFVAFQCHQNYWSEDTIYDDFPLEFNKPAAACNGTDVPLVGDIDPTPFNTYMSLVLRCSERQLTYESDAINAAAGVLNFMSGKMKCDMLVGLPTASLDLALLSYDPWARPDDSDLRRTDFPSWSWAGWRTPSTFVYAVWYARSTTPTLDYNTWLQTQTYIVWFKRNPQANEGPSLVWDPQSHSSERKYEQLTDNDVAYTTSATSSTRPFGRAENSRVVGQDEESPLSAIEIDKVSRKYPLLQFWAYTVQFSSIEAPGPRAYRLFELTNRIRGRNGELCGGIRPNDFKLVEKMKGPHEYILLSRAESHADEFNDTEGNIFESHKGKPIWWVILIEWDGPVAERRGLGFVFEESLEDSGKVWKEILLG